MADQLEEIIIHHLLEYAVIEEYRKSCYLLDDLRFLIMYKLGYSDHITEFFSGSKVEGMSNYGDLDIMFCFPKRFPYRANHRPNSDEHSTKYRPDI